MLGWCDATGVRVQRVRRDETYDFGRIRNGLRGYLAIGERPGHGGVVAPDRAVTAAQVAGVGEEEIDPPGKGGMATPPAVGVDEDPATGSAHCFLSPYWSERLGRNELVGYQASARGGVVKVRLDRDRVHLGGQAVTVLRGELI